MFLKLILILGKENECLIVIKRILLMILSFPFILFFFEKKSTINYHISFARFYVEQYILYEITVKHN